MRLLQPSHIPWMRLIPVLLLMLMTAQSGAANAETPPARATSQPWWTRMVTGKLRPDVQDAVYGPDPRNKLDFYKARSDGPTPVVVYFHGGGFRHGSKALIGQSMVRGLLQAGVSVVAADYGLLPSSPLPKPMYDGARAVQFVRHKACEWNLDPTAIAIGGQSAGAGIALWVAFHDDLADPKSEDPVARRSSRVSCVGVLDAQTSYAPDFVRDVIGGKWYENPALLRLYGLTLAEADSPRAHRLYHEAAPISFISRDDPPVWMGYLAELNVEVPSNASPYGGVHSPKFGLELQKRLVSLNVKCTVCTRGDDVDFWQEHQVKRDWVRFFIKTLHRAQSQPSR